MDFEKPSMQKMLESQALSLTPPSPSPFPCPSPYLVITENVSFPCKQVHFHLLLYHISVQDKIWSYLHEQSCLLLVPGHLVFFAAQIVILPKPKSDTDLPPHPAAAHYTPTAPEWLPTTPRVMTGFLTRAYKALHGLVHACISHCKPAFFSFPISCAPSTPVTFQTLLPYTLLTTGPLHVLFPLPETHFLFFFSFLFFFPVNVFSSFRPQFLHP